ncbi:MAG TPA: hypothetical protein PLF40_12830 [Kofleriaceae bacterium]|nr:hypothetical protein [Kofleriaceae bacterium]
MIKLISASLIAIAATIGIASYSTSSASAGEAPCKATEFKTELVKAACEKGGQKEAKAVMKTFMKEKKIKSCNACHTKLAPNYEMKKDALKQFTDAGGK